MTFDAMQDVFDAGQHARRPGRTDRESRREKSFIISGLKPSNIRS
jgi:hypothetical protein